MSRESLARRLRVLRAERGLTLRQVEEMTGVDKHTISNVERGESKPYDATLARLARGYDVPVSELLMEKTEPEVALPLAEAPQAGQSAQEWAREQGARLHGMTDAEFNAHVRALDSVEDIEEEYRAFLEEAKMLHAAFTPNKWQHPEGKGRRAALSSGLRDLLMFRSAELQAAKKLASEPDEPLEETIQTLLKDVTV